MRKTFFALFLIALGATGAYAQAEAPKSEAPKAEAPKTDKTIELFVERYIPLCADASKVTQSPIQRELPKGYQGTMFKLESGTPYCGGQYVAITSPRRQIYVGMPWLISDLEGTIEQKLTRFTWDRFSESFTPVVGSEKNEDGLIRVRLLQTTEHGKVPFDGWADPDGKMFFLGTFFPWGSDPREARLKALAKVTGAAPTIGPSGAPISIIEFSDFQCPSCKAASSYLKPILDKYGDQVRYTRVDMPLMSSHPWAFGAAVIGRAIHKQSPDAFWKYKTLIYDNQDKLNIFTLDDFARGFAKDSDLDMTRFDADVASDDVRLAILEGLGAAFTNQVQSTPTFLINGRIVMSGINGENLERYIAADLEQKKTAAK